MTQTTTHQSLIDFAQEVGRDYKALRELLAQQQGSAQVTEQIQQAINQFRSELMGGNVDAQLDTLKELGDKLRALENDDNLSSAILQKFSELAAKITALEQWKSSSESLDLLAAYNRGKGAGR